MARARKTSFGKVFTDGQFLTFALFSLLGIAAYVVSFRILFSGHVGWDSPLDTLAYNNIMSLPRNITLGEAENAVNMNGEWYGILIQQLSHLYECVFRNSCLAPNPLLLITYFIQGSINILIALIATTAFALLVGKLLNSAIAGAMAFATYSTIPLIVGMNALNFKDVPLSAGFTLCAIGAVLCNLSGYLPSKDRKSLGLALIFLGSVISVGTRPGSWVVTLFVIVSCLSASMFLAQNKTSLRKFASTLSLATSAFVLSLLVLFATHPFARIDYFEWLVKVFQLSSKFPAGGVNITLGYILPAENLPWWYVPAWIFAQLPVLMCLLLLFSIVYITVNFCKKRITNQQRILIVVFGVQGLVIPLIAVVSNASLYNGIRHLLFLYPFVAILITVTYQNLHSLPFIKRSKLRTRGLAFLVITTLTLNIWAAVRWYPYSYAFVNPIAAGDTSKEMWELDGWAITSGEVSYEFSKLGITDVRSLGGDMPHNYPIYASKKTTSPNKYGLYYLHQRQGPTPPPQGCKLAFSIERDGQSLAKGFVCDY
jgi:hypothetical protein